MKTYPIMLPSHGGEDVQAATLTEYADGSCSIETGSSITTDHKAAAIDVIKRRWPSAYLAEAVRIEPEAVPEPTLGDLLNLAVRLNGPTLKIDVEFNAEQNVLYIDTNFRHDSRRGRLCEIRLNPDNPHTTADGLMLAAKTQAAIDWLTDLHKQSGNPAA